MTQQTAAQKFAPPKTRQATELEEAVTERGEAAQADGFVLVYFMDAETKEFTGFSRIHKPDGE